MHVNANSWENRFCCDQFVMILLRLPGWPQVHCCTRRNASAVLRLGLEFWGMVPIITYAADSIYVSSFKEALS